MGDVPASQQAALGDYSRQQSTPGSVEGHRMSSNVQGRPEVDQLSTAQQQPTSFQQHPHYHAQHQHYQQRQHQHQHHHQLYNAGLHPGFQQQGPASGVYDMSTMANTLPKVPQYGAGGPRYNPVMPAANVPRQVPVPVSQYASQLPPASSIMNPTMYMSQPSQMPYYGNAAPSMSAGGGAHIPPRHGYNYYPSPIPSTGYYYPPQGQSRPNQGGVAPYSQPSFPQGDSRLPVQPVVVTGSGIPGTIIPPQTSTPLPLGGQAETRANNIVRGPPRKPKQSGHAIWVGNLPPQTDLMSLVHHVCRNTTGLESLFLISKSYCAFANFRDEQSCLAAHQKLNETRFMSVRLVSRLRKNAVEGVQGVAAPTAPAALAPAPQHLKQQQQSLEQTEQSTAEADSQDEDSLVDGTEASLKKDGMDEKDGTGSSTPAETDAVSTAYSAKNLESSEASKQKDRYFILKSLTVEDLELSVRTGIWATQSHNEATLNSAFKSCDNVYLVFSANRSGEYFGYAKMTSEINEDPEAAIKFAPKSQQTFTEVELPRAIETAATESTPRGWIIDDSDRGTIFWEIHREEGPDGTAAATAADPATAAVGGEDGASGGNDTTADDASSVKSGGGTDGSHEPKVWGKPFQLEWLSTSKVSFFRTRGMRNPLNSNREIKIARDGTELDPVVGQRLVGLFHQPVPEPVVPMVAGYATPTMGIRPPY